MRKLILKPHYRDTVSFIFSISIILAVSLSAQDSVNFPTIGEIIRKDKSVDTLLAPDAKIEVLSSGFVWSEGPVWVPEKSHAHGGFILFSDIPNNRVVRWDEGKGAETWLQPSGYTGQAPYGGEPGCNGLILDAKGQLISCEHGDRRLSVLTAGGGKRTLVDNYEGKRLNSPNDVCLGADGKTLYFTDPPYGLPNRWDDPLRELDFCGVYRLDEKGKITLLTKEMTRPNGIAFSPDFKTLYVAQSDPEAAIIKAFPVKEDGTVGEGSLFYDATDLVKEGLPGLPDGLKVDEAGNLWATAPGGVHILSPEGKLLGRIATGEKTANCTWGNDGSVLYITADTYLCRIQTLTKGAGW
ncbi:SMP-30/gluconolactonase/LRE family protein [Verrucomicrobiales bacterium BCK34]|nr:SMP-30/gluconolactonase/LRE family protein [Verrucomicrobiales bacterium BCK34]